MLVMSLVLIYLLEKETSVYRYTLSYRYYTFYYALRTGVISFITYFGIILGCDIIENKYNKKQAEEQKTDEEK